MHAPLLLTTDAVGGVWRYTIDLARGLPTPPVIAILGPPPSTAQRAEAAGLRLIETGLPLDWTADSPVALGAAVTALRALATAEKVAAAHLHAPALVGPDPWPIPTVAVAHSCVATWWQAVRTGPLPPDLAWRAEMTAGGLRAATAIIAPTDAHAEATRRAYGPLDITPIHNGTPPLPLPLAGKGRGEGRAPAILTAGRLWDDAKNAAALDRAAPRLATPRLATPIHAAGPTAGPNGARADLPNLHHLGTLDAPGMARAYAEATVFASLALYEPFGLAVLEAARAGLTLVLSDIGSFRELWDGAATFVPPGADPVPALRAALDAPPDTRAQTRAACYTLDRMIAETLALHRRVAA